MTPRLPNEWAPRWNERLLYVIGFGPSGWGGQLAYAALMTLSVAFTAFGIGLSFGAIGAAAKLSPWKAARAAGNLYTT